MTSILLVFVPSHEGIGADVALTQLRALASTGAFIVDGPIEIKDSVPSTEAARLSRAAEVLKEASRRKRIAEGLARAKTEGRRIGRPLSVPRATIVQIVLDRASGRSWSSIEQSYRVPRTSARRLCQKELHKQSVHQASRQEAKRP